MKPAQTALLALLITCPVIAMGQAAPREINGARNSAATGTSLDTNVSFSLHMTLAGDDVLRDSAESGQDISISAIIRPETGDIGRPADIVVVDFRPPVLSMRNIDGNFVAWNGSLRSLVPSQEGVSLQAELSVEVFSGRLGTAGEHRIFIGFLVGDDLYFTPSALRLTIHDAPVMETSARELAIALFESTISPAIVQSRCITCHVNGGQASGQALHIFVPSSNADHLSVNLGEFEEVHAARGTTYILNKVQGMLNHGGGIQLQSGTTDFNNLSDFLDLLDDANDDVPVSPTTDPAEDIDEYYEY